jgi:hypothetical protein
MATRAIVTSQPVLACDMCGRRLLRGEQPEIFRVGAERRTVCELCAPRAAHEGWLRETDVDDSLSLPPSRRRRGGSLLGRLRQLREPAQRQSISELEPSPGLEPSPEPDLCDEALAGLIGEPGQNQGDVVEPASYEREHPAGSDMGRALEIFNTGEHPRRMGGVARSLGSPAVTVRPIEGSSRRFTIVVAWELCWYRYEVDLDDELSGALLLEKGMELDELPGEDRAPNAAADERGELALAA